MKFVLLFLIFSCTHGATKEAVVAKSNCAAINAES